MAGRLEGEVAVWEQQSFPHLVHSIRVKRLPLLLAKESQIGTFALSGQVEH